MDDQTKTPQLETFKKVGGQLAQEAVNDGKDFWQSKTFWAAALMAIVPAVFPPAAVLIAANPALVSAGAGAVVLGLRHLTSTSIKWPWS